MRVDELGCLDYDASVQMIIMRLPYLPPIDSLTLLHKHFQSTQIRQGSSLHNNLLLFAEIAEINHHKSGQNTHLHVP